VLDYVIRYEGRRDNIAIRQAAMIALLFILFMVIVAIVKIMKTVAKSEEKKVDVLIPVKTGN
jgi:MFS transporter, DHA2 family, multidrug resistance protein